MTKILLIAIIFMSCAKRCYKCDIELYECPQPCDSLTSTETIIECDLTRDDATRKENSLNYEYRNRTGYKKSKANCYPI